MKEGSQKPSENTNGIPISHFFFTQEKEMLTPQKLKRIREQEAFKRDHLPQFRLLTKREVEIIRLLARGYNNPKIAEHLFISRNTVQQHRKNINRKLKVKSFSAIFQYALAFDLI